MKVGDYIKHIDDTTGTGPDGSWTIVEIDTDGLIYFDDGCHSPYDWIMGEIRYGRAHVIYGGLVKIERGYYRHYFGNVPSWLPF